MIKVGNTRRIGSVGARVLRHGGGAPQSTGGTETRPANRAYLPIIKL